MFATDVQLAGRNLLRHTRRTVILARGAGHHHRPAGAAQQPHRRHRARHDGDGDHPHDRPRERGRLLQDHRRQRGAAGVRLPQGAGGRPGAGPRARLRGGAGPGLRQGGLGRRLDGHRALRRGRRAPSPCSPRWWSPWRARRRTWPQPGTMLLFQGQAERLKVKVGDTVTLSAPTAHGVNNTSRRPGGGDRPQHRPPLRLQRLHRAPDPLAALRALAHGHGRHPPLPQGPAGRTGGGGAPARLPGAGGLEGHGPRVRSRTG